MFYERYEHEYIWRNMSLRKEMSYKTLGNLEMLFYLSHPEGNRKHGHHLEWSHIKYKMCSVIISEDT